MIYTLLEYRKIINKNIIVKGTFEDIKNSYLPLYLQLSFLNGGQITTEWAADTIEQLMADLNALWGDAEIILIDTSENY